MANKFRSFLTILGIVIGVGAVIVIMAVGQSAQALILDQVKGIGSNLVGVLPGASEEKGPPAQALGIVVTTLKYDDFLELTNKKNVPGIEYGCAYVQGTEMTTYSGNESMLSLMGVTHKYLDVENIEMDRGRFFVPEEDLNMSRVAVLGPTAAKDLFGTEDPLNKKIKIKKESFTVIGITKEKGTTTFGVSGSDDSVILPLKTAQKIILGIDYLSYLRLKVADVNEIPVIKNDVIKTLRIQHDIKSSADDDFSVRDTASALSTLTNITDVLRYFLLAVGSISLIVGGVGIMNIMLISVNQRIREVGLRKAVGAKNVTIMLQFLIESATVTLAGGLVGIVGGVVVAFLISTVVTNVFGYNWEFIILPQSVLIASIVSVAIGLIFGIYPARKASKISPMEALRYE
jgi:putative ABC transport system permease protein